jgi:predicted DNA-binding transcriptional regulator AlpA
LATFFGYSEQSHQTIAFVQSSGLVMQNHPMATQRIFLGLANIAELLSVSEDEAAQILARDDFPDPRERLSNGMSLWFRLDVEGWIIEHSGLERTRYRGPQE